jgi:glyoxylase-like metal-dependent hydrolase (beta-lactamase superfamily II)
MRSRPYSKLAIILGTVASLLGQELRAQADHFNADLLPALRRAAMLIPGEAPTSVNFEVLNPFTVTWAYLLEGGNTDTVAGGYPVFQIRFPRGWITVDAALDRSFVPNSKTFDDSTYRSIHEALRGARLAVVTHEHHDHVAGVLSSPALAEIQAHTMLTNAQIQSLLLRPNNPRIKIDSAVASRYLVTDYDPIMPIGPGVVLIKAPGHTAGSQIVYVRLAAGSEIIIAGDVAWNMRGIDSLVQKPAASTRGFGGEDKDAIAKELRWLRDVAGPQTHVVVSHDVARLNALVSQGKLRMAFDLSRP